MQIYIVFLLFFFVVNLFRSIVYDNSTQVVSYSRMHE